MTNPYTDASVQLPAGVNELPGYDPYWETYPRRTDQDLSSATATDEMFVTVGAGESLMFEAVLFIGGAVNGTAQLTVHTPPKPNGGFHLEGMNPSDGYDSYGYGADSFNTAVGNMRTGISGTLTSFDTHHVMGVLHNGQTPGRLRIVVAGDGILKPGSHIRAHRIFDARKNEVGA